MTNQEIKIGDTVTYDMYGEERKNTVSALSRDGKIIFFGRYRFIHRESVKAVIHATA